MQTRHHRYSLFLFMPVVSACSTVPPGLWPTADDWKQSVRQAATDPATWIPLAGSAVVLASGRDHAMSDRATSSAPVFGSMQSANEFSNDGRQALKVLAMGSALLAPAQDDGLSPEAQRAKNLMLAYLSGKWGNSAAGAIKGWADRDRPNGNTHSFPSGHATESSAYAAVFVTNMEQFDNPYATIGGQVLGYSLSTAVAWSRVEAQAHYPSDVLAGMALGNFIGAATYGAFLRAGVSNSRVVVAPLPGGAEVSFERRW